MSSVLCLYLSEEGADSERTDTLTGYLRADLIELDVADVAVLAEGAAPTGARSGVVAVVGGLLVSLGDAAGGLASVVTAIAQWLKRGETAKRSIRLELDGDVLELSHPSSADERRLIELFISRHQPEMGD
jgi:hypothetical protein